jgi:hypothetical protein
VNLLLTFPSQEKYKYRRKTTLPGNSLFFYSDLEYLTI